LITCTSERELFKLAVLGKIYRLISYVEHLVHVGVVLKHLM